MMNALAASAIAALRSCIVSTTVRDVRDRRAVAQFGGHEVADAVELRVSEPSLGPEPLPPPSDKVWPQRPLAKRIAGEDEPVGVEGASILGRDAPPNPSVARRATSLLAG